MYVHICGRRRQDVRIHHNPRPRLCMYAQVSVDNRQRHQIPQLARLRSPTRSTRYKYYFDTKCVYSGTPSFIPGV